MLFLLLSALFSVVCSQYNSFELDKGTDCNNNSTIKWHFDFPRNKCFPYKHLGCGGSRGFDTYTFCQSANRLMDYVPCPGAGTPKGSCKGPGFHHPDPAFEIPDKCDEDYFCSPGWTGVGTCCPNAGVEAERADRVPPCPAGTTVVRMGTEVYAGVSCSHDFCTNGSKCQEGQHIAYCCQAKNC